MTMNRFVRGQLAVFSVLTVVSVVVMAVWFMRIPSSLGIGKYTLKVELTDTGGLYATGNVTYRGLTVGRVESVDLTATGVEAVLTMDSSVKIPSSSKAEVHSRSAIGEQYVDLVPTTTDGPYFGDNDVIPVSRTSVPQDIGPLIDTVNKALTLVPKDQLTTVIDESSKAFSGNDSQIRRILDSSNLLLKDANGNIDPTKRLIADLGPVLKSQAVTSDSIRQWASSLSTLSAQAARQDTSVRGILRTAPGAAAQANALFQQLRPTVPILLGNLVSLGQIAVTYNASLEQILVILPQGVSALETIAVPDIAGRHKGFLSFNTPTINAPPPCTTGFLPASERRDGSAVDAPPRTDDPIYCAIPQNSQNVVRGARNLPCMDKPGKRAPTIEICKSDEPYRPKGTNPYIGNPTPTVDNPVLGSQISPSAYTGTGAAAEVRTADYDPATGGYIGPDGAVYTQTDLRTGPTNGGNTWQKMLTPAS